LDCGNEEYNVVVFDDFRAKAGAAEGKVLVGDDAWMGQFSIGAGLSDSEGTRDDLSVFGTLTYKSGYVPNGNIVAINGSVSSIIDNGFQGVNTFSLGIPNADMSEISECYNEQQYGLCHFNAMGGEPEWVTSSKMVFSGDAHSSYGVDYMIFNATCEDIARASEVEFDTTASTVIVQLSAGANLKNGQCNIHFTSIVDSRKVVFTTCDDTITTIKMRGHVKGSFVVPHVDVDFREGGQLDGQLIASDYTGSAYFANKQFNGCLPYYDYDDTLTGNHAKSEFELDM
jgi:choice-of-anchor A domain-containing protein